MLERTVIQLEGKGHSIQQIEDAHRAPNEWAATFINNLRLARKSEPSAELKAGIEELIAAGEKGIEPVTLAEAHDTYPLDTVSPQRTRRRHPGWPQVPFICYREGEGVDSALPAAASRLDLDFASSTQP